MLSYRQIQRVIGKLGGIASLSAVCFAQVAVIPAANVTGVVVGSGYVKAQTRQVVRTAANVVYVFAVDDSGCLANSSPTVGVIRAYKGAGSQALSAEVPVSFAEVDAAHHPAGLTNGSCLFNGGVTSTVFTPDVRMDSKGLIHLAYMLPQTASAGNIVYQTFSPTTDTWGPATVLATNGQTQGCCGSTRYGNVAISLDASDHPFVTWASTSSDIQWAAKTASSGGSWTTGASIAGSSGSDEAYPSMGTAPDGSVQVVWQDNAFAAHETIRWARFSGGAWGGVETVTTGDANVLSAGDDDQSPSIVFDSTSLPHVLYMDGTANGTDNYVRLRYRTMSGIWTDDSPPDTSGGVPNSSGTWPTGGIGHTPQNYMSASGTEFIFLGHNTIKSPAPFEYQTGVGTSWSSETEVDPCNTTTLPSGEPGCDGAASIRYDSLRDNNPGLIDFLYYKENDGTSGYTNHGTIWYKALQISSGATNAPTPDFSLTFAAPAATVAAGGITTASLTVTPAGGLDSTITFSVSGCPPAPATCTVPSVSVNGDPVNAVLTITTASATIADMRDVGKKRAHRALWLEGSLGLLGFIFIRRRASRIGVLSVFIAVLIVGIVACSGGESANLKPTVGTPPGTYNIVVTGSSGNIVRQSNTFVLTVQ